jgi:hypothetical protein
MRHGTWIELRSTKLSRKDCGAALWVRQTASFEWARVLGKGWGESVRLVSEAFEELVDFGVGTALAGAQDNFAEVALAFDAAAGVSDVAEWAGAVDEQSFVPIEDGDVLKWVAIDEEQVGG